MPKAMPETDIDPVAEQVDQEMLESGQSIGVAQHAVDLSNGGRVGSAEVIPVGESGHVIFDKKKREQGRPMVRNVWRWNGIPDVIPLSYTPSGKTHDGGRAYLLKRHCPLCKFSGFFGPTCPACEKAGRRLVPVVAAYYLKEKDVPDRQKFYGFVDCFVSTCIRSGEFGFLDEAQMLVHGMSRHRIEYKAYEASRQNRQESQVAALQQQVNALLLAQQTPQPAPQPVSQPVHQAKPERTDEQRQVARDRMAKVRAGRKAKAAEGVA